MRWVLGGAALVLACAPARGIEAGSGGAQADAAARDLPAELVGVVPAWQRFDPAWAAAASVWAVGTFFKATYPCVPGPDGSLDMIELDGFTPTRVLRGTLRAREVDIDAYEARGPGFPTSFVEGRSYLLMLRPDEATARKLADPEAVFGMHERLGREQLVAIVDLSQSSDEARDDAVSASRSGTRDGLRFDPGVWAAARAATQVSAAQHGPVAGFIAAQLLAAPGATVAEVRAWLGEPDVLQRGEHGLLLRYWLAQERYAAPVEGVIYGQVELRFAGGRLREGSVLYFRWRVTPEVRSSSEISDVELGALGLRAYRLE